MKTIITLSVGIIFSVNVFSQAPNWLWAKSAQGQGSDYSWGIATDPFGNSYITGAFTDTLHFGSSITLQTDAVGARKPFVAKYDALGNVQWANVILGRTGFNYTRNGICLDDVQNCYVIGEFWDSLTINSTTITSQFYNDSCYNSSTSTWYPCVRHYNAIFIAKFNSSGNLIWVKKISESKGANLLGNAISVDNSGNCYITGSFTDTLLFNNSSTIISYGGSTDIFVAMTDANGNGQWIKKAGGIDMNADIGYDISVDNSGNSYTTGIFRDTATFDSYILNGSSAIGVFMFLAKYDGTGNCVWAKKIGGNVGQAFSIDIDQYGNSYVTGSFFTQANFDTISLISYGIDDIFIAKYSPGGNCLWAKNAGGFNYDEGNSVAVDTMGNSYITGDFRNVVHFDTVTLTSNGIDIFVAKYNSVGNLIWVVKAGCISNYTDEGWGIALDNSGSVFITGLFAFTSLFDSDTLTSAGGSDIFIAKLNTTIITENNAIENFTSSFIISPNPATNEITIHAGASGRIELVEIYDVLGRLTPAPFDYTHGDGQSERSRRLRVDVSKLSPGIYFVKVKTEKGERVGKFVKE